MALSEMWRVYKRYGRISRCLIGGLIGSFLFVAVSWLGSVLPPAVAQSPAPALPNIGNCNNFGNNNFNCNTLNLGPPRRSIPESEATQIAAVLKQKNPNGIVEVHTMLHTCADCDSFAKQIEGVLRSAPNLQVKSVRDGMAFFGFTGAAIQVRDTGLLPSSARAIIDAFKAVGATLTPIPSKDIKDGVDAVFVIAQPPS